ncbi:unnamed protein product [Boreogadus saida]
MESRLSRCPVSVPPPPPRLLLAPEALTGAEGSRLGLELQPPLALERNPKLVQHGAAEGPLRSDHPRIGGREDGRIGGEAREREREREGQKQRKKGKKQRKQKQRNVSL